MPRPSFEWDPAKDRANREKHGVGFAEAQAAFLDPNRLIFADAAHGGGEPRFFCLGKVGDRVMTVRFTWRDERIRLIGAGFWRKGRQLYERARR
jgi:uncharacterized DUF497 family protein